jgi:hypothetical protein
MCQFAFYLPPNINLGVEPIKKNGETGVAIGYSFRSEFKDKQSKKIIDAQIIKEKPISMRQQLSDWGVGKKQIDTWIANLDTKTINDASLFYHSPFDIFF